MTRSNVQAQLKAKNCGDDGDDDEKKRKEKKKKIP